MSSLAIILVVLVQEGIHYVVDATDSKRETVRVQMTVRGNRSLEVSVTIPSWSPGAYGVGNYHERVKNVCATDSEGCPLKVECADAKVWKISVEPGRTFVVSYEMTPGKGEFNDSHYSPQGPSTYFYLVDHKDWPCRVTFKIPPDWKIATGLNRTSDPQEFTARDYDTFIDCPAELGRFERIDFTEGAAPYEVVLHSEGAIDEEKFVDMLRKVVRVQCDFFGGPPFDRYVFIFHLGPSRGGGLEHLNSTSITLAYEGVKNDPLSAAALTSHEFFHLWNVKRIRPRVLGPFDYTGPVRTNALWFCEGVTSYYGDLFLARSGIWDEARWLQELEREIEHLQDNSDRRQTSLEMRSWTVWDPKEGARISYYNKGFLVGALLDLEIRHRTRNRRSLDDVMKFLYRWFVLGGGGPIGIGYEEGDLLRAVNTISGHDFSDFFSRYVSGVEELPFAEILGRAGLEVAIDTPRLPYVGVHLRWTYVDSVDKEGAAEKAGIKAGDRIRSLNGIGVDGETIRSQINSLKGGEPAKMVVTRDGKEFEMMVMVELRERTRCAITRSVGRKSLESRIFRTWLGR